MVQTKQIHLQKSFRYSKRTSDIDHRNIPAPHSQNTRSHLDRLSILQLSSHSKLPTRRRNAAIIKTSHFINNVTLFMIIILNEAGLAGTNVADLSVHNSKLAWLVGRWRSEFSGKIVWPTVPTMTYGEELNIGVAPQAKTTKAQFFNYSARAWSHSTKDHFHDEWGFMTVDSNGNATLMTTGNNGFTTYEVGKVGPNKLVLVLKDIGRISFSRDLPVEDLRRTFIRHDDTYLEQILEMRTATHPRNGYLEHTRVIYAKVNDKVSASVKSQPDVLKSAAMP